MSIEVVTIAFVLVLARVSSFILSGPIVGTGLVPNMVKTGTCVVLGCFWVPDYLDYASTVATGPQLVFATFVEVLIGLALGYWIRIVFLPIKVAGTYLGQELGFNLGQITDSTSGSATNEMGALFDALGLVLFWGTDCHHESLRVLAFTAKQPSESTLEFFPTADEVAVIISEAHHVGLGIVAPLATVLFIAVLGLMIMMRAWPQINLFTFGSAARLMIGWIAMVACGPLLIGRISNVLRVGVEVMSDMVAGG